LDLKRENIEAYLRDLVDQDLELKSLRRMGETIPTTEDVKGFGYGAPLLVEYVSGAKKALLCSPLCGSSTASATTTFRIVPGS